MSKFGQPSSETEDQYGEETDANATDHEGEQEADAEPHSREPERRTEAGVSIGFGGVGWSIPKYNTSDIKPSTSTEVDLRHEVNELRGMMSEMIATISVIANVSRPSRITFADTPAAAIPSALRSKPGLSHTAPTAPSNPTSSCPELKPLFASPKLRNVGVVKEPSLLHRTSAPADDANAARPTVKPPRPFTGKNRFEDWWTQFSSYLTSIATSHMTDEIAANYLIGVLSPEVFTTLRGCGLSDADLLSTRAIYNKLQSRFGDPITPELYQLEYPQLKQSGKETSAEFTDRVRQIAHRAYPDRDEESKEHRSLVLSQVMVGLQSAEIKRAIQVELRRLKPDVPTIECLYNMIKTMDADEQQAVGKQTLHGSNAKAEQKKSEKTDKASTSSDKAASNLTGTNSSQASGSDDSRKSKKKKGKGKDGQDDKDKGQKQGSSQAGTANAKPQCQLCNRFGHVGTECRNFTLVKKDGNAGKQSAPNTQNASDGSKKEFVCYRCKKPNHVARNCHQTVDVNGQPLEPVNNAAAAAGSKPSTSGASTHLNAIGGARTESAAHSPELRVW